MPEDSSNKTMEIDGVNYSLENLTENAKAQLANIHFVDMQLQQLNNEWAVADTARIGYQNALKTEINKMNNE